ncbi:hypothetical protein [Streptomyces sp. NPDC059215]|uniref:hypothetical protein n=1 Tax=unclassified Streptomyces TaxID=2593676 RepID=UPI0036803942
MTPQRRITEFGMVAELTRSIMLEPRALRDESIPKELLEYANECHLYLIGHRPLTVVDPDSLSVDDDLITARFISYEQSEDAIVECFWRQPGLSGAVSIESDWPHNVLKIKDSSGRQIARGNASYFLAYAMAQTDSDMERLPVDSQFLDLMVDYVGKAYGAEGSRGAITRLQSHSTLQRILTELPRDMEAWIVLLNSDSQTLFTSIVPSGERGDAADLEDDQHLERALSGPLSEEMIVDFLEGSLIKYFQPPYNVQLKKTFPQASAKPLAELYARDLNLVGFELDTKHLSMRLRSTDVRPSFGHVVMYPLHDPEERKDMFDFVDDIEVLRARRADPGAMS